MRVLFISDVYLPRVNGVSTSIRTFRRELAALGHPSILIAPSYPGRNEDEQDTIRIPSYRVPLDPEDRAMHWRCLLHVHRVLAGEWFDVVHIQTPFLAHYAGLALARRWGVPAVATYHTLFEEYLFHYVKVAPRGAMRALARRFSRKQCNALDAVVVPSTPMHDTLLGYGVEVPLVTIPTGIPLPEFSGGDGARFRKHHGIEPDRPVALFVGRVAFEKNIDFLLRMFAHVREAMPDALLVVCGEGPARSALMRLAGELRIASHTRFVGYLDRTTDLLDCYRAADAFVFASRTETQGLVLLEAMALGVPVVSTAVMGTRDILVPDAGALVVPEDEGEFAAAVVNVLSDAELRRRLSNKVLEYAKSWAAPQTARKLLSFYDDVVAGRLTSPSTAAVQEATDAR